MEYVDIMLQPELIELLGSATPKILTDKIPVTENRQYECLALQQEERRGENAVSPFGFRPQRVRIAVEDEFFEVGRLYGLIDNIAFLKKFHSSDKISTIACLSLNMLLKSDVVTKNYMTLNMMM